MNDFSGVSRSRMARYLQLATLFRNRITSGAWPLGERIPNVADLAVEFAVARGTIREAMGVLESEGLIERFRGKGSFVRSLPHKENAHRLDTDWASIIGAHGGSDIRVLEQQSVTQLQAPVTSAATPVGEYEMMRRLHLRDGHPYLVGRFFLDRTLYLRDPERFRHEPTLRILHDLAGPDIASARQVLTIGTADFEIASLLELPLNAPIAHVHRTAIDQRGRLIYLSDGIYRGDSIRLEIDLR